jgi:hypothetical protein
MPGGMRCLRSSASPGKTTLTRSTAGAEGERDPSQRSGGNADARDVEKSRPPVILDADQSAALREKLQEEMGDIASADLAAGWAREALIAKNSLTAADAKLLEDAFEQRLSELASSESAGSSSADTRAIPRRSIRRTNEQAQW